jgi:hypothetical protein
MLLEFVNEHRLTHDRFKIAIVPPRLWQRRSSPRYYLIYWVDEPLVELAAVGATAQVDQGALEIEEEAAVDTAEQIIASAQRGEDEPN